MQYTTALSSSLQLLHNYESGIKNRKKLSAEEIIRVAGSMFIQFAEALRLRNDKATGRFPPAEMKGKPKSHLSVHQKVPINQIMQLTAIQAMKENVGSARKIHLIDLEIWGGVQWTALMQALADRQRRLDRLKITAVGLRGTQKIEETGTRLETFAKSMNQPFTFKPVQVSCMSEIKEELFETAADETVVVVAHMILRQCSQGHKSHFTNICEPFIEALFFYGAYFDPIFSEGIENKVARRALTGVLEIFRMVEVGFRESSLYQNGNCLIVGCEGAAFYSLSAWKFSRERPWRSFVNYKS
ncbi:DELLA protein [Salix suchowensis]|nr:DELLA protein [Salix suchowensis]